MVSFNSAFNRDYSLSVLLNFNPIINVKFEISIKIINCNVYLENISIKQYFYILLILKIQVNLFDVFYCIDFIVDVFMRCLFNEL